MNAAKSAPMVSQLPQTSADIGSPHNRDEVCRVSGGFPFDGLGIVGPLPR